MTLGVLPPLQVSLENPDWTLLRNLGIALVVVLWLATAYWTFKDARRRIEDPWLVGVATLGGFFPRSSTVSVTVSGVKWSVTRAASPRSKRIIVSAPDASCTNANSSPGWMWRSAEASSCEFSARCRSPGERPFSWKMSASDCPARTAPGRTMLGDQQAAWLLGELDRTPPVWNVLANEVVLSRIRLLGQYNLDQQKVTVQGPVRVNGPEGEHLVTRNVTVDLKQNLMTSRGGVAGKMELGQFQAGRLRADLNDRTIVLDGGARLKIVQGAVR